ncbi:MAG: hypothetical protein KIT62_10710 [Cyclobacteriaceae bacterium]|nr:hypothetical protein [Cyclobacteriaceae bacterium]
MIRADKITKITVSLFILAFPFMVNGQELSPGDSAIVKEIKAKTSQIYENSVKPNFYLTNQKLQSDKNFGLSLVAFKINDAVSRVISSCFTKQGQLSTEYFFDDGKVIFIYQTFEYFDKYSAKGTWKNFKGLTGWECRFYYLDDKLVHYEQNGLDASQVVVKAKQNKSGAHNILNYLAKK